MARPIDPERHQARRLQILDAALTCFAERGIDGTSTARICREAGIGSGTLFHYFATKQAILLALLELGAGETQAFFAAQSGRTDAFDVVLDYADHAAAEAADPRTAGFVRAVTSVLHDPEVGAALAADTEAVITGLAEWLTRAGAAGEVRTDWAPRHAAHWVHAIVDGFVGAVAQGELTAGNAGEVRRVVRRVLAP